MFNANMPSLSDIAAVTGNDRDGGWGGNGWWIGPEPAHLPLRTLP